MDPRGVERILAMRDTQKAGRELEGLGAEARYLLQRSTRPERAVRIAMSDDELGQPLPDPRYPHQQRRGGCVDVHADGIDAVLDHGTKGTRQFTLAEVVLVLADPD